MLSRIPWTILQEGKPIDLVTPASADLCICTLFEGVARNGQDIYVFGIPLQKLLFHETSVRYDILTLDSFVLCRGDHLSQECRIQKRLTTGKVDLSHHRYLQSD